jgi:hypothetical protein
MLDAVIGSAGQQTRRPGRRGESTPLPSEVKALVVKKMSLNGRKHGPVPVSAGCPVPTKKSVLIQGVELAARRGRVQGNVRTPRFPALLPSPLPSNSGRSARGEPGTPSSASCAAARAAKPSSAIAILRPTRLGLALWSLAQLALRPAHCETGDHHRLAPARLSAVLEMKRAEFVMIDRLCRPKSKT